MKVKELIAVLQKADPEMDVCNFSDFSVRSLEDVGIYNGEYKAPLGLKLIMEQKKCEYVGLGNPGDFEGLDIHSIKDLTAE